MSLAELTPDAVVQAIAEFDRLGHDTFLSTYDFGKARDYLLVREGKAYDSKAIAGVAHQYLPGRNALKADEFTARGKFRRCEHRKHLTFIKPDGIGSKSNLKDWSDYAKRNSFDQKDLKAQSRHDLSADGCKADYKGDWSDKWQVPQRND